MKRAREMRNSDGERERELVSRKLNKRTNDVDSKYLKRMRMTAR